MRVQLAVRYLTTALLVSATHIVQCQAQPCDLACDEPRPSICDGFSMASLGSLVGKTDHCFDDFVSPMINFVFFEDPRTLTEFRPIFLHHKMPSAVGNLGLPGGEVQLYAAQFRIALTERLSLIAVKDGYVVSNQVPGSTLDGLLDDGWASIAAGLKYNFYRDAERGTLVSAGFTYDIPFGSQRTLQDVGDGEFHLFVSGGQRYFGGNAHTLSTFGFRVPANSAAQTTSLHWSNHLDVRVTNWLYAVTEASWWHWLDSANPPGIAGVGAVGFAGQDLLNINATNVTGNNLVTQGAGIRIKPGQNIELGAIYEFPLTGFTDMIEDRFTLDMIVRY